jgi:hypothetical protein
MTDLNSLLRAGDPLGAPEEHEGLSTAQWAAMRRQVLNAARRPAIARTPWQQPMGIFAMLALAIAAGLAAGYRLVPPQTAPIEPSVAGSVEGRRQFQFVTPGGTRIIWVFDPEFQMKETLP